MNKHQLEVTENWKTIEEFPDYQISNTGRVRSLKYGDPREMKVYYPKRGSATITLRHEGRKVRRSVPRLVAHHFIRPVKESETVFLKDGDKTNNYVTNLRIGTPGNWKRVSKNQLENHIELHRLSILSFNQNSSPEFEEGVRLAFDVMLESLSGDIKQDTYHKRRQRQLFELLVETAYECKVSISNIRGKSRKQEYVQARRQFVQKAHPTYSFDEIADTINVHRSTLYNYL